MKLHLIVLFVCLLELTAAKQPYKKSPKVNPQSAIIAIQIIDPHENKTSLKNSKRTIDSSLGYGYQSIFGGKQPPPRYETYKYSQHDIPPYNGPPLQQLRNKGAQNYNNQVPASKPEISNYYQPGTVLFSTINQRGQLGDLSPQFPVPLTNHHFPIPVIILRIHPDQLANPIHPNLPQNHYLASAINSIDINSLLSNHLTNMVKQQPAPQYLPQYEQAQTYVQPEVQPQEEYGAPTSYQEQQYYPQYQYEEVQQVDQGYGVPQEEPQGPVVPKYQYTSQVYQQPGAVNDFNTPELLTHENYPSEKHTQVIFKRSKKAKLAAASKKAQSPAYVESSKLPVASHQDQKEPEQDPQPHAKYEAPPMYYTVQYSDDQQYVYRQEPRYEEKAQDASYSRAPESQDYIYLPQSQPDKH